MEDQRSDTISRYAGGLQSIGFLASFFSKNMVVILVLAIVLTHLIRYGKNLSEGFEEKEEEEEKEGFEEEDDEKEGFNEGEEDDEKEGFEGEEEDDKDGFEVEEEGFDKDSSAKALAQNQQQLVESMKALEPMLAKAEGFLQTVKPVEPHKKDGFATLYEAYSK